MKITVDLTKMELDLVEEALLQYQKLLLESENRDEMIHYELRLCRRVFEEFGMEELDTAAATPPSTTASYGNEAQSYAALPGTTTTAYAPPAHSPPVNRAAPPPPTARQRPVYATRAAQYPLSR